jgi:hypothetical protein
MRDFLRRFARNKGALVGAAVLALVVALALLAPFLFPDDPWDIAGPPFRRPGEMGFLLGTDTLGRDVAAGIAHGARVTLLLSLVSTAVALSIGVVLGAIAGYHGGWVDDLVMRFTEFFQTIPNFILLVVLVAIFTPSITSIVVAIGIVSWPPTARLARAEFLRRTVRLFDQPVRHRILKARSHVRHRRVRRQLPVDAVLLHQVEHRRLGAAEREQKFLRQRRPAARSLGADGHFRTRQPIAQRVSRLRSFFNRRSARIAEAHHARNFVERFADRIVDRVADQLIVPVIAHEHQLRMAA